MFKHGYYTVKDKSFYNKIEALIYASRTNSEIKWHWTDSYDKINWNNDSVYSLQEIYKIRAFQLREKYDYLILSFSGGSDSWQICKTFLDNKIKLDELFIRWPWQGSKRVHKANLNEHSMLNQLSEWEFTTKPMLDAIHKAYPNIKITLHDWSIDLHSYKWNDEMWKNANSQLGPGAFFAHNSIGDNEKLLLKKGKKVGFILGIDKPEICVIKNKMYCYFSDNLSNNYGRNMPERNIEAFFWTSDLPEIVHVQVREIYRYLLKNKIAVNLIDPSKKPPTADEINNNHNIWQDILKSILYPGYGNWFQAGKENSKIYSKIYHWLFKTASDSTFLQSWRGSLDNVFKSIDKKYYNIDSKGNLNGLKDFVSKFYFVGNLNNDV